MSTTSQPLNFKYNTSIDNSTLLLLGNQSNTTSSPDNNNCSFTLGYQMLAILGIIFFIVTFSAVLNNYLNYKHQKQTIRRNKSEVMQRDESSKLLEKQPPGSPSSSQAKNSASPPRFRNTSYSI